MTATHQSFDKSEHRQFVESPHRVRNAKAASVVTGNRVLINSETLRTVMSNLGPTDIYPVQFTGDTDDYRLVATTREDHTPEMISQFGGWSGRWLALLNFQITCGATPSSEISPTAIIGGSGMTLDFPLLSLSPTYSLLENTLTAGVSLGPYILGPVPGGGTRMTMSGGAALAISDPGALGTTDLESTCDGTFVPIGSQTFIAQNTVGGIRWVVSSYAPQFWPLPFLQNLYSLPL